MTVGRYTCTGKYHEKELGKETTVRKRKQIAKQDVQHCPTFTQDFYALVLTEKSGRLCPELLALIIWGVEWRGVGREVILLFSRYLLYCTSEDLSFL